MSDLVRESKADAHQMEVTTLLASAITDESVSVATSVTLAAGTAATTDDVPVAAAAGTMGVVMGSGSGTGGMDVASSVPLASAQNLSAAVWRGSHSRQYSPGAQQLASC